MANPPAIRIFEPDTSAVELSVERFPLDRFLGKWNVVWSTLPLWKDKKDVCITYIALPSDDSESSKMDDLVEYRKQSASNDSQPSTVKGVDTLDTSVNGATFNWRGKGWLMIASSHWQFLGYDEENPEPQWAVTYFSKTLFTPAGLDIYMRQPLKARGESGQSLLRCIIEGITVNSDKEVARLAKEDGFLVGGSI